MIRLSLIAFLGLSACAKPGDFCDVYLPVLFERSVAEAVVKGDREAALNVAANQAAWSECGSSR